MTPFLPVHASVKLAPVPESAGRARDFVEETLRAWECRDVVVDDARVVITELVSSALDKDRALRGKDIFILTVGRVVYLRGYADTLKQVERAGMLARRVEGVGAVSNAIRVSDRPNRA